MTDRKWFIVRTTVAGEARAARSLREKRIRVYVPKMRMTTYHHRTKKRIDRHFVLFNRYLFIGLPADALHFGKVRDCKGVEAILGIQGVPFEVSRADVTACLNAQRRGEFDNIDPRTRKDASQKKYKPGSFLRVRNPQHPFGGFYGQVVKVKGRGVVQAMIAVFGRLSSVELLPQDIEPAEGSRVAA